MTTLPCAVAAGQQRGLLLGGLANQTPVLSCPVRTLAALNITETK